MDRQDILHSDYIKQEVYYMVAQSEQGERKILTIDDTNAYLLILYELLSSDYETYASLDGESGIETARDVMPDLILLDLVMPGMSGFEVLEKLKSDDELKHIPVIILSGKNLEENMAKARDLGAVGYLKKPLDLPEVKSMVNLFLREDQ